MQWDEDDIEEFQEVLRDAKRIVVLAGAGLSAASGKVPLLLYVCIDIKYPNEIMTFTLPPSTTNCNQVSLLSEVREECGVNTTPCLSLHFPHSRRTLLGCGSSIITDVRSTLSSSSSSPTSPPRFHIYIHIHIHISSLYAHETERIHHDHPTEPSKPNPTQPTTP